MHAIAQPSLPVVPDLLTLPDEGRTKSIAASLTREYASPHVNFVSLLHPTHLSSEPAGFASHSQVLNMADDDFFSDLMPTKRPAAEPSASGLDDIFTEESPVLAQPISEGPSSSSARSNGELTSPYARSDAGTHSAALNHAPMGMPAAKREAQHIEAVLQRFAAGLEEVLGETKRCASCMPQHSQLLFPTFPAHAPRPGS